MCCDVGVTPDYGRAGDRLPLHSRARVIRLLESLLLILFCLFFHPSSPCFLVSVGMSALASMWPLLNLLRDGDQSTKLLPATSSHYSINSIWSWECLFFFV